jgi:hypothetical protein
MQAADDRGYGRGGAALSKRVSKRECQEALYKRLS